MTRPRSPQEKKALSYDRDRYALYGQNHKASRRIVPLRKAHLNRAHRCAVARGLAASLGLASDPDAMESLEHVVTSLRLRKFDQHPGTPLREVVAGKLAHRRTLRPGS